jgi:hypothetical protein
LARAAHFKKIALITLAIGLPAAALVYALFPDSAPTDENSLASQYYKQQELETQKLWGGGGSMVLGITRSLQRPITYEIIIVVGSVGVALACLVLAGRAEDAGSDPE